MIKVSHRVLEGFVIMSKSQNNFDVIIRKKMNKKLKRTSD